MSLWLTVAIWIILILWSIIEVVGMYVLLKHPKARYTMSSSIMTYFWIVFVVCWFCFQFID
jgi:hypothetical protein